MHSANHPEGSIANVQHGWDVYGSDEQRIGIVADVEQRYILAHMGTFFPKDLYIPVDSIERIEHDRVYLNVTKDDVDSQGWEMQPTGDMTTGMTERTDMGGRDAGMMGMGRAAATGEQAVGAETLHLHEEELRVNKERVQAGEVRLGKEVVEEQKTVNVPVTREEVFIERRPGDRRPDDHAVSDSAGQTIRVPVSEERVSVENVLVPTGEVGTGKRQVQETQQVGDSLKSTTDHSKEAPFITDSDLTLVYRIKRNDSVASLQLHRRYAATAGVMIRRINKGRLTRDELAGAVDQVMDIVRNTVAQTDDNILREIALRDLVTTTSTYYGILIRRLDATEKFGAEQLVQLANECSKIDFVSSVVKITIADSTLSLANLSLAVSAITDLATKCWLITRGRYADLIRFVQSRDTELARETGAIVTRVSYGSPFNLDVKIDASAPSVATALTQVLDGVTQISERRKRSELDNQQKMLELEHSTKSAEQERQRSHLDLEKRKIELEKQRLEILEQRLDLQRKSLEYALEMAKTTIGIMHPDASGDTRTMLMQTLVSSILQMSSVDGLQLSLPSLEAGRHELP